MTIDKTMERVLVVPADVLRRVGDFQGFNGDVEGYLPKILEPQQLSYRSRAEVEEDPTYKQIIPYIVLRWQDQVFHYTRGKRGTESRLLALRSIGVGGHISADDSTLFDSPYREAMFRELAEEVNLESTFSERCIGLINDDSTPVGQVHLGVVHVLDLAEPKVQRREQVLTRAAFSPISELKAYSAEFETWSQFVLEKLE